MLFIACISCICITGILSGMSGSTITLFLMLLFSTLLSKLKALLTRQPLGLRATRQPPGGIKLPPFTSAKISSQREEIEKRTFAHTFLNT